MIYIYIFLYIHIYIYALCNISSPVFVKLRLSQILRLEDAICRCQGLWMHEVGCMFSTQRNPWQKRTQGFAAHCAQKPNTSNDCLDCRMTVLSVLRITQSVKNSQKETTSTYLVTFSNAVPTRPMCGIEATGCI